MLGHENKFLLSDKSAIKASETQKAGVTSNTIGLAVNKEWKM